MKKLICFILSSILILSVFAPLSVFASDSEIGTTYYIDSKEGNDENNGKSPLNAWQSISAVNNFGEFSAGDKILFKRGCVYKGIVCPKGTGTEQNPITLGAYGDETLRAPYIKSEYMPSGVFDGEDEIMYCPAGVDTAVYLYNQNHWIVENLEVTSSISGTGEQYGIYIGAGEKQTVTDITIRNNYVHGTTVGWDGHTLSGLSGIVVSTKNYSGRHDGINIIGNTVKDVKGVGINVIGSVCGGTPSGDENSGSSHNVYIANNYINNAGKDGIIVNNCVRPVVEYNTVDTSHTASTAAHVAIWPFACLDALFQYNEAFNTKTSADGQGFDCDYQCTGTTFQYNYSHDNEGGFMLICTEPKDWNGGVAWNKRITVRYNISQNDKHNTFSFTGHITDTYIHNNVVYNEWTTATNLFYTFSRNDTYALNTYIYNNIFHINSGGGHWNTMRNTYLKNNIFYGRSANNFPNNQEKVLKEGGTETEKYVIYSENNYMNSDPKFANAGGASTGLDSCNVYKIKGDSPAINKGLPIENHSVWPCKTDFFGNSIEEDTTINIGAYNGTPEPVNNEFELIDGKYDLITDWEEQVVGKTNADISPLNGDTTSWSSTTKVIDNSQNASGLEGSKRALEVTGKYTGDHVVSLTLRHNQLKNATGIRVWLKSDGADRSARVNFVGSGFNYYTNIGFSGTGKWCEIDFANSKFYQESTGKEDGVDKSLLTSANTIKFKVRFGQNEVIYVDDVQLCVGGISTDYDITADGFLKSVPANTSYADFVSGITKTDNASFAVLSGNDEVTSGNIGTGMTIKVKSGDGVARYTIIIEGDVSGDGDISSLDLLMLKQSILSIGELDRVQQMAVDLVDNGKLNSTDLLNLKQLLLK